jgi:TonB family protein
MMIGDRLSPSILAAACALLSVAGHCQEDLSGNGFMPAAEIQPAPAIRVMNINDEILSVADWRSQIIELLERNKRYPDSAPRDGERVVKIFFSLDRRGQVTDSRIISSSGLSVLDEEALALVRRSEPFPPTPQQLKDPVNLTVPIRFSPKPKAERPALAEPLTDAEKSAFRPKMSAACAARYGLGYDEKGKPFDPPFTEQEVSNYCECVSSTLADVLTQEESMFVLHKNIEPSEKLKASMLEKTKCIVVEKCKKHLNLAHPEKFQYEQCWKG